MDSHEMNLSEEEREKKAVQSILLRILEKWRTDLGQREQELEKTLILTPGVTRPSESPSASVSMKEEGEAIPETVILPPREHQPKTSPSPPSLRTKGTDSISKPEELSEKDEFLEETVILKPKKAREKLNE